MIWPRQSYCKLCRKSCRKFRLWLALAAVLSGAACTQVPELDATIPEHLRYADFPDLVPLGETFAITRLPRDQARQIEQSLAMRRDRLQARAKALNPPVRDANSRQPAQDEAER